MLHWSVHLDWRERRGTSRNFLTPTICWNKLCGSVLFLSCLYMSHRELKKADVLLIFPIYLNLHPSALSRKVHNQATSTPYQFYCMIAWDFSWFKNILALIKTTLMKFSESLEITPWTSQLETLSDTADTFWYPLYRQRLCSALPGEKQRWFLSLYPSELGRSGSAHLPVPTLKFCYTRL